jgi:hypothetical protein
MFTPVIGVWNNSANASTLTFESDQNFTDAFRRREVSGTYTYNCFFRTGR